MLAEPRPPVHASDFPLFVFKHLRKRHGMKSMVQSACLELVCHTDIYRAQSSDVELFALLLCEAYRAPELAFIVSLRAAVKEVVGG